MTTKIAWFHLRNSTGVVDIEWEPELTGANVIGGKSRQGKTAILNNIAWLLGGDRYKPEKAQRDGSDEYPDLDLKLDNGLRVTRKGKRSSLKVVDPNQKLGNQSLLREFVGSFALDAPKFLRLNGKEKAEALLNTIGVGDELRKLDSQHDELYKECEAHGRVTVQKEKYAAELEFHKGTPEEETSAAALIAEIRKVDAANAENEKQRLNFAGMVAELEGVKGTIVDAGDAFAVAQAAQLERIEVVQLQLAEEQNYLKTMRDNAEQDIERLNGIAATHRGECEATHAIVEKLADQPTDALQEQLAACEETNARVRANAEKKAATTEGGELRGEYVLLTDKIEKTRADRIALLDNADLPLPGLGVLGGELTYDGLPWDNLATSDQMKVAAAIASRENPQCGFVLLDGLETMDTDTLAEFGEWATEQDLQVIGTRVSTGDECSLIVQEGKVQTEEAGA